MSFFARRRVYLDYASATPIHADSSTAWMRASVLVGNPGGIHQEGVKAAKVLEGARAQVAHVFGCKPQEIIFTSGGTEANNLAIVGRARNIALLTKTNTDTSLSGTHWAVSAIEHPSVLDCFGEVERMGGEVTYIEPDSHGVITAGAVAIVLKKETVCVSVGWANSEIGTIMPIAEIARAIRTHEGKHKTEVMFHSDAGQAPLYLPTTAHSLGIDVLTLDSGKLYGPRGVGALYISPRTQLSPILHGGGQEHGLRPGTENVALVYGFASALVHIATIREAESKRVRTLRNSLCTDLISMVPQIVLNGDLEHSLPHMLNISISNIQSEYITLALDHAGFAVSTKSACMEGQESESHVVSALGGDSWRAKNTLRISLGEETRSHDLGRFLSTLVAILNRTQST